MMRSLCQGLALAALLLTIASCGEEPSRRKAGRGYVQRLRLEVLPEGSALQEDATQVAEFVPREGDPRWSGVGDRRSQYTAIPPGPNEEDRLPENRIPAWIVEGNGELSISLREELDPQSFNAVVVQADAFGTTPERLRVILKRGDKNVLVGEWQELISDKVGPTPLVCSIPQTRGQLEPLTELVVDVWGNTTLVAVTSLSLIKAPLSTLAPASGEDPGHMVIENDARSGWALSSSRPLGQRVRVPEGARLRFSAALVPQLRRPSQVPQIAVHVKSEAQHQVERFSLENRMAAPASWHPFELDLEGLAGEEVELEFRMLVQGEDEGWAFIAEPALSVPGETAPTVLLITSDTHRADHVGSGPLVQTPHLDALSARGLVFTDAFTATNVTNPSHVCLMTGLTPLETRIVNNHSPLAAQAETLAERFRDAGWRTFGAASAFHLQHSESGLGQGFDRLDAPRHDQRWGEVAAWTLEHWVAEAEGEPLFVWLHLFDAHSPYEPPPSFSRRYWEGPEDPFDPALPRGFPEVVDPPKRLAELRDPEYARAQYRAGVDYVDSVVGDVLSWPRMREAWVAFTADHGECFGENGVWFDHAELYPTSIHVPLILAGPDVPAAQVEGPARQYDVAHTLLAMSGTGAAGFPGRDLRSLVEEPSQEPRFLVAAHEMSAAINLGRWHLILHLRDHQEWSLAEEKLEHSVELYDLEVDPGCGQNLVEAQPDRARALRKRLLAWLEGASPSGLGTAGHLTPELAEQLAALGYSTAEGGGTGALYDPDCSCPNCLPWKD